MFCDNIPGITAGITADIINDINDGGHNLSIGSGRTLDVDLPDLDMCAACSDFSGGAASVHFLSPLGGGFGPRVNCLTMDTDVKTPGGVSFTFTVAKRHEIRLDYGVDQLCLGGTPAEVTKTIVNDKPSWKVVGASACISEKKGKTRETFGTHPVAFTLVVTEQ